MRNLLRFINISLLLFVLTGPAVVAQQITVPVIQDGQAQIIPEFENPEGWIRHDLWVETEFDTDGDGKPDRVHVSVTRPKQTESGNLKLPVVYETSPYYAGTAGAPFDFFWNVEHEVGQEPPARKKVLKFSAEASDLLFQIPKLKHGCRAALLSFIPALREPDFRKAHPPLAEKMNHWLPKP